MPTGTITQTATVGGLSISSTTSRTAAAQMSLEDSLPVADAGTLSTRASDTAGTLTMTSGAHVITTADVITIFWADDGSGNAGCSYNAVVGTVSGTSVPFTLAEGTVLPPVDTVITADEQVSQNLDFDGDNIKMIVLSSTKHAHALFLETGSTTIIAVELTANEPWVWVYGQGIANPLAGNPVDTIEISQADSSNTATIKMGLIYDSEA